MNEVVTNRECEEDCGSAGARCQPGLVLVRREGEGQGEGTAAGRQFRAIGGAEGSDRSRCVGRKGAMRMNE